MMRSKFSEAQISFVLKQADDGTSVDDAVQILFRNGLLAGYG